MIDRQASGRRARTRRPGRGLDIQIPRPSGCRRHPGRVDIDSVLHAAEPNVPDSGGGTCVLIADDDPDILGLLGFLLEQEGYEVLRAVDGLQALQLADEHEPALCVLDVSMPGVDGYAVCRELQARGQSPPTVIFLTAHAHTTARVSGLDAGAVDYVVKPFNGEELMARIRAASADEDDA